MGSIIDMIKSLFVGSNEDIEKTKSTMKSFLKQALNKDNVDDYGIVYGKSIKKSNYVVASSTTYYSYMVAFNQGTGEVIIIPIDSDLTSYGEPVFVTKENLKKAKLDMFGVTFDFEFNDKTSIDFEVPEVSTKLGNLTGGYELPISQKEEAKAFKQFFKSRYKS